MMMIQIMTAGVLRLSALAKLTLKWLSEHMHVGTRAFLARYAAAAAVPIWRAAVNVSNFTSAGTKSYTTYYITLKESVPLLVIG